MKYFINTESRMLGSQDTTFWMLPDTFQEGLDKNFALVYDTCLSTFRDDLRTIEYDDETNTIIEIDQDGENFVSTVEETPEMQKLVDLFNKVKEQKQELDEAVPETVPDTDLGGEE